jgi:hypothetical protein
LLRFPEVGRIEDIDPLVRLFVRSFVRLFVCSLEGNPMQEIIEQYIAAWNETDPGRRRELIDSLWAVDGSYTDPLADVRGRDEFDATIAAVQQQFPGLVFTLGGPVDANHHQARFSWHLGPAGGEPLVIGFDVAVVNDDGQIRSVHGFLDKVPAAA